MGPATARRGHSGYCGDAAAVLKVGEEELGGAMKTMRGRRHPTLREVVRWKPATSSRGDGDDSVQRRNGPMGRRGCRAQVSAAA
jgi:hypothetical protein